MDAARLQRMRLLLAQIDAREVEPAAMRERYGLSVTDARTAVRAKERRLAAPKPRAEVGRVKGVWMRPEIEGLLRTLGEDEGGQGHALARALSLLSLVRWAQAAGATSVVVDLRRWQVTPQAAGVWPVPEGQPWDDRSASAQPGPSQAVSARTRAARRWCMRVEECGQVRLLDAS